VPAQHRLSASTALTIKMGENLVEFSSTKQKKTR
jgi:hypothetical protein